MSSEVVGSAADYMLENQDAIVATHEGVPLYIELPASVVLEITYTEPGVQGDRATGGTKPATLSTVPRSRCRSSSRPARRSRWTPATGPPRPGQPGPRSTWARAPRHARPRSTCSSKRTSAAQRCRPARRQARRARPGPVIREYTATLVSGVVERWTAINDALTTYSHGWTLDRMPAVDRSVLRLGRTRCSSATRCPPRWRLPRRSPGQDLSTADLGVLCQRAARPVGPRPSPPWSDRRRLRGSDLGKPALSQCLAPAYLVLVLCMTAGAHG